MNPARTNRATYVAAFLLGALLALLLLAPARAAEPAALDRLGVVRFTAGPDNTLQRQAAVLHDDGRLSLRASVIMARPTNTPAWVLGRNLVPVTAWAAYQSLGYNPLSRFELHDGGVHVFIGEEAFLLVAPNFETWPPDGRLINLSARLHLGSPGSAHGTVGFVIDDRPRKVLIRAIGPTLARFGIGAWLQDPKLEIWPSSGPAAHRNDNWSDAPVADDVRQAASRVGAFALDEGSADAAALVELPPGAYTVLVQSASPTFRAGDVLVEIYTVPAN